jgi:hypothetical protein
MAIPAGFEPGSTALGHRSDGFFFDEFRFGESLESVVLAIRDIFDPANGAANQWVDFPSDATDRGLAPFKTRIIVGDEGNIPGCQDIFLGQVDLGPNQFVGPIEDDGGWCAHREKGIKAFSESGRALFPVRDVVVTGLDAVGLHFFQGFPHQRRVARHPVVLNVAGVWDSWVAGPKAAAPVNGNYPSEESHHQTIGNPPAETIFPTLTDWTKHNDAAIRHYAGTAVYETKFTLTEAQTKDKSICLDLGEAAIMATVSLNGREVRTLWCPPWRIDMGGCARAGENHLQVRVVNTWHNRLVADAGKPENERLSHISQPYRVKPGAPPAASGLLGPVRVLGRK